MHGSTCLGSVGERDRVTADETLATLTKRFDTLGIRSMEQTRRTSTCRSGGDLSAWRAIIVAANRRGMAAPTMATPIATSNTIQRISAVGTEVGHFIGAIKPEWALANLGHKVSHQTVGNVLRRHSIPPAPERKHTTTWTGFIRAHLAVLAGTDFFTVEVLTLHGLVTYYVLFFIHLASRRVEVAGITANPTEDWMKQMARNGTMEECGALGDCRYLLHDRDTKYTASFLAIIKFGKGGVLVEGYSVCENSLRRAMREYVAHYHAERNHQGKPNILLFPRATEARRDGPVECRERLGGLLGYYHRDAA